MIGMEPAFGSNSHARGHSTNWRTPKPVRRTKASCGLHLHAVVGAPEAELATLVAAAERVCYVTNTLRAGVELTTEAVSVAP